jgi:hypothetical protein
MKRERLRRILALATIEILGKKELTIANIKRYVVPCMTLYNIRLTTKILPTDIAKAIQIVRYAQQQKPISFWYRRDSLGAQQRKDFLRSLSLSDIG